MVRWFVSLALAVAACGTQAAYNVRLYYRDATTGEDNPGALIAHPGDVVEIWFSFHKLDTVNPYRWGTLQITLCFDGLNIVDQSDKDNWRGSILASETEGGPASDFLATVTGNGQFLECNEFCTVLCHDGLYGLLGINGSKVRSADWDAKLWSFTVQPYSAGETLGWLLAGRDTATSFSTRILDQKNRTVDPTDNFVTVVPEPGIVSGFGVLCSLLALRRRS